MKLYYTKGACSLACRIVINEIGLDSEYIAVNLKEKKTESGEDFNQINKKGVVPVLVTDNGTVLTENAVIQQYLADNNPSAKLLPPIPGIERYQVLEWLNYIASEIHKGFAPFCTNLIPNEVKEEVLVPLLKKKFNYMDNSLQNKEFLYGDHFTLPDAYLFVMLTWALHFGFNLTDWPNLIRYFAEMKKRPSIVKSLKEEGLLPT